MHVIKCQVIQTILRGGNEDSGGSNRFVSCDFFGWWYSRESL